MNSMRKMIFFVFTVAIAVFALPSMADQPSKLYGVVMCVGAFVDPTGSTCGPPLPTDPTPPPGTTQVEARIFNQTPTVNSAISSFDLFVDLGWTIVGPVTVTESDPNASGSATTDTSVQG